VSQPGLDTPGTGILEAGLSPVDLGRVLELNEGKKISLKVYNAKSQRIRGTSLVSRQTFLNG
jgi:hypothetical protein